MKMSESLAQPGTRAFVETVLATWCCLAGDQARAERHADVVIGLAVEQGMPHWDAQAQITRGLSLAERGRGGEGADAMRAAIAALTGIGTRASMTFYWAALAEAELGLGRIDGARASVGEGLRYMEESDERVYEAGLHTLAGRIAHAAGEPDAARAAFERALAAARAQDAAGLERRTLAAMRAAGM
jgi:tetratricopeptide (TPR) repeat protein